MVEAADLMTLGGGLWLWQAYDPAMKADLSSTVVQNGNGLFLIDPIRLSPGAFAELTRLGTAEAVLVTNSNHPRAAVAFAEELGVSIFASESSLREFPADKARPCGAEEIAAGVTAIPIDGAAPGEVAFLFRDGGGTLVVGDALINFEPYGFSLLPAKYCSNQKVMRASLRQLIDLPFERLAFAHGSPILKSARSRLGMLLR